MPDGRYIAIGGETSAGHRVTFYTRESDQNAALGAAGEISRLLDSPT